MQDGGWGGEGELGKVWWIVDGQMSYSSMTRVEGSFGEYKTTVLIR